MAATTSQQWTSKLGNKYDLAWIRERDVSSQRELKRLRSLKDRANHVCADCGRPDTTWASVTHGVFLCVTCSDVHRSVGTHLTKVKGCTGTYLWGPDELEKMQERGNSVADLIYGSRKIAPEASKAEKQRFVESKYKVELATQCVESLQATSESLAKARLGESRESTTRARTSRAATLLTSMPRGDTLQPLAKKVDIPDNLFDELFADWSNPATPQTKPTVQKVEVPLDSAPVGFFIGDVLPLDASSEYNATCRNSVIASKPNPNIKTRSQWGVLGDVDDIFADLNSIDFTVQ